MQPAINVNLTLSTPEAVNAFLAALPTLMGDQPASASETPEAAPKSRRKKNETPATPEPPAAASTLDAMPTIPTPPINTPAALSTPVPTGWPMTQAQYDAYHAAAAATTTSPSPFPQTTGAPTFNPAPQVPIAPQAPVQAFTQEQLARAGAQLVDMGKRAELIAALGKFGAQALTGLPPAQYGAVALELRALGATI